MLKELNATFGALCSTTSTTAKAVESGAKILLVKGEAAKMISCLEAIKAVEAAKEGCSSEQLKAAEELLALID